MRIEDHLRASAARAGAKIALIAGETQLTYGELDGLSDRFAAGLSELGVRHGDRIVIVAENCAEAVVGLFGAWKAGAVPCPIHASIKSGKLRSILASTRPAAILAQARFMPVVDLALTGMEDRPATISFGAAPGQPGLGWLGYEEILSVTDSAISSFPNGPEGETLGLLIHTSGSTGTPKGVMHSHESFLAACGAIIGYLENTSEDVVLSVLPISFGYGLTQIVTMAMVGGTLVLDKSFAFPRKTLARMAEMKVTGFPVAPAMAVLIAGMRDLQTGFLPELRYITNAAAAMPQSACERLRELLPASGLFLMYGQTECIRATYLPAAEAGRRPLSVGGTIPGGDAFVIDEAGNRAPAGVVGELVVEGPHVMLGYWQDEAATAEKIAPVASGRRLHTGDLFKSDEEGFLYFVSRRDDIIKTRGEKVSPQEVEQVLYALPGIREAAVVGIDDPVFGQLIRAYIATEPGVQLTEKDILRHCAQNLEDYMVPKSVEFRDALPRTSTGKIRMTAEPSALELEENVA